MTQPPSGRSLPRCFAPLFCLALLPWISLPLPAGADPSPLVTGVSEVRTSGIPGPVHPLSSDWDVIAAGDEDASYPSAFILARDFGLGRVLVVGHEGLLASPGLLDNGTFLVNATEWLDSGLKKVAYTTAHGEFIQGTQLQAYETLINQEGFTLQQRAGLVNATFLSTISVLIVGNTWNGFNTNEITAVRDWVSQGGGLILAGLGWSWPLGANQTMDDYPMNVLAAPFEVRWLRSTISDPTNNDNGSAIFSTLYPDAVSPSVTEAIQTIHSIHTDNLGLMNLLETDAALRLSLVRAHETIRLPGSEYGPAHPERQTVFDACEGFCTNYATFYTRTNPIDPTQFPTSAYLRERMWRTFRDCLELTPTRKTQMATAGLLQGMPLQIFTEHDVLLLDNAMLDSSQLTVIDTYLDRVPATLHNLRTISVRDYLGSPPTPISLDGAPYGVNIFGFDVGQVTENSFPGDAAARVVDTFSSTTAHELNHIVDAFTVGSSSALSSRKTTLISDAGTDPLNYLRSRQSAGFFVNNPQEFFASISNQWFTDSLNTVEHGLSRFDGGRLDPINQALFFADVYAEGGATTHFYTTDNQGNITYQPVGVGRDDQNRLNSLAVGNTRYKFDLSPEGRVTGYRRLTFTVENLTAGETATFRLTGGPPNEEVAILWGTSDGNFSASQGNWCVEFEFDIPRGEARNRILFTGMFDNQGEFEAQLPLPAQVSGRPIRFQAAVAGSCPVPCMSVQLDTVIQ